MHGRAENKLHYDFSFIAMAGSDLNCGTSSASAHFRPWDPPPHEPFHNGRNKGEWHWGGGGVKQEGPERGGDGGKEGRREGVEIEGRRGEGREWRRRDGGREWRWREGRTEGGSGV